MANVGVGQTAKSADSPPDNSKRWRFGSICLRRSLRTLSALVAVAVIFLAGVGVGSGRIYPGMFASTRTGLPASLNYQSVNQVYQLIRSQYDGKVTAAQLIDGLKAGMVSALNDPYSEYFTAAQASDFNSSLTGTFTGIGAELGQTSGGALQVIAPINGSPAAKAGLQSHDLITAIDGKSTTGMSVDAAVSAIRGAAGTKVTLTVTRGDTQNMQLVIVRAQITVPSVTSNVIAGTQLGYIQISQFSDDTGSLAADAARSLLGQHVRGVILDLRNNPGGLVDSAVDVSSLWLPKGATVLQTKRGNAVVQTYAATGNDVLQNVPTVVLINGGTASAAEITAGALHDHNAATIVGEQSYGKGVMQVVDELKSGAELKVTIASWYRPDGQNINHKGITPDKIVKMTPADVQAGNDPQKTAAESVLGQ